MKFYRFFEDGFYIMALMGLSLGIPEECAFEYNLKELLLDSDNSDNSGKDAMLKRDFYKRNETFAGSLSLSKNILEREMAIIGANGIHGPPN